MKNAVFLMVGILSVALIAATACGGDDDEGPARRPSGTTAPVATVAPAPPTDTPAPAPTDTPVPAAPTTAPAAPTDTAVPVAPTTAPAATAAPAAAGGEAAAGQVVFLAKGCGACHTVQGVDGAAGQIGPELTNVATNAATRIAGMSAEAYMRQSEEEPGVFLVAGFGPLMPSLRGTMTDDEFEDLIAFLMARQ